MAVWVTSTKKTAGDAASPLLLDTLEKTIFEARDRFALDLGCGSGRDTRELLKRGWQVTAVDASEEGLAFLTTGLSELHKTKISLHHSRFEDFTIPEAKFNLVNASFSLPFCEPAYFSKLWNQIIHGLKAGGVFCGQFFGPRDSWATSGRLTIHTRESIDDLMRDFNVLHLDEVEQDAPGRTAPEKHWHVFHVVAQKRHS